MRTIFAMIAFLLGGGDAAAAQSPASPAKPDEIVAYHDSGDWDVDIDRVVRRARRQIIRHRNDDDPALVLDIDDTSLSTYECLKAVDFDRKAGGCGARDDLPAVSQTRELYKFARRHGVTVFFITGRRAHVRASTRRNLRATGYSGKLHLRLRPNRERPGTHDGWKARTRAAIEDAGYTIVANVGDQRSDLDGGHALRRFKLPNPMYVIPTA
jgi:predicted secreted acid phosphatase